MLLRAALLTLVWIPAAVAVADTAPCHVDVYVSGTEGYFAFRIPAIETAADGSLLAFAEARKYNLDDPGYGKQDIDLVLRRSTDQGRTWSPMQVIEDPGELWSAANPATIVDRQTGRVWLFYLRCKPERNTGTARPGTDDTQVIMRWSGDHGVTWSEPQDGTLASRDMDDPEWRTTVVGPGGGIQLQSGRLIVPAWKTEPYRVFTLYSDDHGATWQRGALVPGDQGFDESQLVELADGRVLIDMRQNSGAHRWMSVSDDQGHTWSPVYAGNVVSPVACAIERFPARIAPDQRERILWTGPKGPARNTLVVRVSYDQGRTFENERIISDEPAAYSDLTLLPDSSIGCLWERGDYKYITFTRFDLAYCDFAQAAD
ncbi:MAG: exo-alpha-sialidase [Planctomycetaceae bacterium]|nr:exo-alpha-sialidase [Planctomycetaceae bacterium]